MATPKPNKDLLGKGIRSLLQSIDTDLKSPQGQLKQTVVEHMTHSNALPIQDIQTNPKQPRHDFDEAALNELAHSIKLHGIIQPVTVSQLTNGKYRLIAGERRWRAAQRAGLTEIPAYIRQANDQQLLELALLENLQRENLNAVEVALSYKRMMDELNYSQEEVAERMGKDRSTVANFIRLLKLPPDIQLAVRNGKITMGHARALVNVGTVDQQLYVFREILSKELSVRQTESLVRNLYKQPTAVKKAEKSETTGPLKRIQDKLASHFSTRVHLHQSPQGDGAVTLEFYTTEELNKILRQLNVPLD
jgi:ParB family chromosome partitioning protein